MKAYLNLPEPVTPTEMEGIEKVRNRITDIPFNEWFLKPTYLVRCLRARNGNVEAAEAMIRNTARYMVEDNVADIMFKWTPPPEFKTWVPWRVCSVTEDACAVVVAKVGKFNPSDVKNRLDDLVKYSIHLLEVGRCCILLKSRESNYVNMPSFVGIVDCTGFNWWHYMSYDFVQAGIRVLKIMEAHHPESLRAAVVLNAPSVIKFVWRITKPFMHERTQKKVNIVYGTDKKVWRDTIGKFIPENMFPKEFGGDLDDEIQIPVTVTQEEGRFDLI